MKKNPASLLAAMLAAVHLPPTVPVSVFSRGEWYGWPWRGQPSRNYGSGASSHTPHQGAQECIRRDLGGFAAPYGNPGFTKRRLLDAIERGHLTTYNDMREFKYGI